MRAFVCVCVSVCVAKQSEVLSHTTRMLCLCIPVLGACMWRIPFTLQSNTVYNEHLCTLEHTHKQYQKKNTQFQCALNVSPDQHLRMRYALWIDKLCALHKGPPPRVRVFDTVTLAHWRLNTCVPCKSHRNHMA